VAFITDGVRVASLGSLGGLYSTARDINARLHVVGGANVTEGPGRLGRPFVWTSETGMVALPVPQEAGPDVTAVGINRFDVITGNLMNNEQALLWIPKDPTLTTLRKLP
jgi:hypothetical protein